jgi:hypothetical protein
MKRLYIWVLLCLSATASNAFVLQEDSVKVASQNPSPMTESVRKHERIVQKEYPGITFEIRGLFAKPVQVFVARKSMKARSFDLLVHFHGAGYVTEFAATRYQGDLIGATLNVGSGSKVYNDAFQDSSRFTALIDSICTQTKAHLAHGLKLRQLILSGFSAGYGAIRRIISSETNYAKVNAVLLLDGIHTSYIPDRKVLAEGGRIDSTGLFPYLRLATDASAKKSGKRFLISHSEIFPGTFVSTTEATEYLLGTLSIQRKPVLQWGPLGMQQLSSVHKNHLEVMGFAGNTARDHVDHLQALYWFLNRLRGLLIPWNTTQSTLDNRKSTNAEVASFVLPTPNIESRQGAAREVLRSILRGNQTCGQDCRDRSISRKA